MSAAGLQVIRYPWYAATTAGACPAFLTWLRYTAFIILYPIGVVSEVWLLVQALPSVKVLPPPPHRSLVRTMNAITRPWPHSALQACWVMSAALSRSAAL